ncbi:MAG: hypothetical protein JW798_15515 [Prolixibacteraceae bacterium]|nr:hypothetical protein [Prolixibacteraceae bacterium]
MIRKIIHCSIIIMLFCFNSVYGQVNQKVTFSSKDISIELVELSNGNIYSQIKAQGMQFIDSIGYPSLPVKYINLLIPANSKATGITLNKVQSQSKKLNYKILPVQYPETISFDVQTKGFIEPDKNKYDSETPFPSTVVEIIDQGIFRDNHIVTLAVYPFQYFPIKNELNIIYSIDFTLNYNNIDEKTASILTEIDENSIAEKFLKSLIDNKADIGKYGVQYKKESSTKSTVIEPEPSLKSTTTANSITVSGNYVIVTSQTLAPVFNEFIAWKKRKGVDISLVTIENIYANYTGDLISGINDNAGKLRQFLKDAYNNGYGIDYALLAGDNSIVPIRYGYDSNTSTNDNYIIPTDLYFSEFNGDWKADTDDRHGEPHDNVDFNPEIFVGRIMVTSEAEVKNWTKKVKTYELNPGNGNYSYLTKAFFTQADQLMRDNQANYILTRIPWITAPNRTIYEEQGGFCTSYVPCFPTGNNVISEFNNHYGLCSFMAHGRPCAVGVSAIYYNSEYDCSYNNLSVKCANNTKYKVTAFDNGVSGCGTIAENGNGFDNMTNVDYPSVYYSISCTTMPFDDFEFVTSASERNMGESYTCISSGGGPIYLGNTRYGWVGDSYLLFEQFINAIKDSSFFNIGIAETKSKKWYNDRYLWYSHNLLGCPETELWTAIPTIYSSATVTENGTSVTVNTGGVTGSTICVMSALDNGVSYFNVQPNVSSYTFTNVSKPYYVTIDKHNYIPYTKNPTTVLIENKTLTSSAYLNCQTLSAGYSVDPNHTPDGNVVIQSGASVTFDTTGDILLAAGFEVQLGATFEAK